MIDFIVNLFSTSLANMKGIEFVAFVLISIAAVWLLIKILKYIWKFFKLIAKGFKNLTSAKEKCKKIQCTKCGRTLDKCICESYKKKSSVSKLLKYKKEHKKK